MSVPCGRLSLEVDGEMSSVDAEYPAMHLKDLTSDVNRRLLPNIPKPPQVTKVSACVIGGQGTGKSVMLEYMSNLSFRKYGKSRVHVIYTDDIRVGIELLNDQPVQLVIIDDAMTNASSREVYEQVDIIKVYNRSRHVYENILKGRAGVIIYVWAWQRFGELDPSFRQGDIYLFKSGIGEPSERRAIEQMCGVFYTKVLWQIWDRMLRGNNLIKSRSVACIPSMNRSDGVGIYVSGIVDTGCFPKIVTHDDYFGAEEGNADLLDEYRDKPPWDKRIRCYEMVVNEGKKQVEVATLLGVRQGYVSESVSKVRDLLKSK